MAKKEEKVLTANNGVDEPKSNARVEDIQTLLDLFKSQADGHAETSYRSTVEREKETFELLSGRRTSIFDERQNYLRMTANLPQNYEPKYAQFFSALGDLAKWSDDERKAYHKPHIAAKIINEFIYSRFPPAVIKHIEDSNPYVKWCTRLHKHYLFLSNEGILLLEKFIDDAVTIMRQSYSVYEFKKKYAELYGVGFQPVLFEKYLGLID